MTKDNADATGGHAAGGGARYGHAGYDWVSLQSQRTPKDYPYSHSEYYEWRSFEPGDTTVECYYTDRMRSWDSEKYRNATDGKMRNWGSVPRDARAAQEIVADYFGADCECVGIIQSMNVSNGYPLGVFCIRKPAIARATGATS